MEKEFFQVFPKTPLVSSAFFPEKSNIQLTISVAD
jgi:hypothetical protein